MASKQIFLFFFIFSALSFAKAWQTTETLDTIINNGTSKDIEEAFRKYDHVFAVMAILLGFLQCLFGYKLFKPTLFVCGFALLGIIGFIIADHAAQETDYHVEAAVISLFVAGLIGGCIVLALFDLGVFVIGGMLGCTLAILIQQTIVERLEPSHPRTIFVILLVILAFAGGLLAFKLQKPIIIIATSVNGSYAALSGIGFFAGNFPSLRQLFQDIKDKKDVDIGWQWTIYLLSIVALAVAGMAYQFSALKKSDEREGYRELSPESAPPIIGSSVEARHIVSGRPMSYYDRPYNNV